MYNFKYMIIVHNLDGQRTGRTGDAALEELAKELEACRPAGHHAQQHEQQRDYLCHSKQYRKCCALGHQRKVQGQREAGAVRDGGGQTGPGEHLLEERLEADQKAKAENEEQAAERKEQRKLWLEHQHRNVERG